MTNLHPGKQKIAEDRNTFSLLQELSEPGKRWFGLFALMVLGAMIGYGIHLLNPPVYPSSAAITFTIDFTRTGEMTDVETDIAIVTVGDILLSNAVVENTLAAGYATGLPEGGFVLERTAFLERYSFRYELVVENSDPQVAAKWANLWADQALSTLNEAKYHALNAESLNKQMLAVQNCLQQPGLFEPVSGGCNELSFGELQAKLSEFNTAYLTEKNKSLGFLPAMDFSLTRSAEPAFKPERQQTGVMVLSGALLGAVLFTGWIFFSNRPHRRR